MLLKFCCRVGVSGMWHFQCFIMSGVSLPAVDCLTDASKGEIHSSLPIPSLPTGGGNLFRMVETRENTSVLHILPY